MRINPFANRFETKIIVALLVIAIVPLLTSVVLVDQLLSVVTTVYERQIRQVATPLNDAAEAYRALFDATKTRYKLTTDLIQSDTTLNGMLKLADQQQRIAASKRLQELSKQYPDIAEIALISPQSQVLAKFQRELTLSTQSTARPFEQIVKLGNSLYKLHLRYLIDEKHVMHFQQLGHVAQLERDLTALRSELTHSYKVAFLSLLAAVLAIGTGVGLWIARRTTRRVATVIAATKQLAAGDLTVQVPVQSSDELADLAHAFNQMVKQLREGRDRLSYLERIGAWQDVARRLAHEIKNPLTPIQLAVQQLHQKYTGDDAQFRKTLDESTEIVREEIGNLRRLVDAFSRFARLPQAQLETIDLHPFIDELLRSHTQWHDWAQITWQSTSNQIFISGDRMLLKGVFVNLVENALQAHYGERIIDSHSSPPATPELHINITAEIAKPLREAIIAITDDGPGISPEHLDQIFEPYFTTKTWGTGLGLSIVKRTIFEHGGSIAVTSAVGRGTKITLHLPVPPSM